VDRSLPNTIKPPPYSDAAFTRTDSGFEIEFKVRDPYHRRLWLGIPLALLLFLVVSSAMIPALMLTLPGGKSNPWVWLGLGVLTIVGLPVFSVLITLAITPVFRACVIWDGTALFFGRMPGNTIAGGYCFPIDEVTGLRIYRSGKMVGNYKLSAPYSKIRSVCEKTHVEVVTPDGVIVVLRDWAADELRWAVQTIADQSGAAILPDRVKQEGTPKPKLLLKNGASEPADWRKLSLALLLVVIGGCSIGSWSIWKVHQAAGWPSTQAQITHLDMVKDSDGDKRIKLSYEYEVNGRTYSASRFRITGQGVDVTSQFVGDHKVGHTITIYYDPKNPNRAAVRRGYATGDPWIWFVFSVLAAAGIVWIYLIPHRPKALALQKNYYLPPKPKNNATKK